MNWIDNIARAYKKPIYSQYGEEHYIKFILDNIGHGNKKLLDIGANDGKWLSNSRLLIDNGWSGTLIDGKKFEGVEQHFVTKENILSLIKHDFDFLSIDIDGNDYWVLREILTKHKPRLIVSEYNAEVPGSKTIKYYPDFQFVPFEYYGYTFDAGIKLANEFGYTVIFQNSSLNMYYVRNDLITGKHISNPGIHKWWGRPDNIKVVEEWVEI